MAVPASTFCPGAGSCEITMEAGDAGCGGEIAGVVAAGIVGTAGVAFPVAETETAGATVILPTTKLALSRALVTVPKGCPTKLGMTNACGEGDCATSKLTFGAETSVAFAGGSWATT